MQSKTLWELIRNGEERAQLVLVESEDMAEEDHQWEHRRMQIEALYVIARGLAAIGEELAFISKNLHAAGRDV